jgi:hypothetical protein
MSYNDLIMNGIVTASSATTTVTISIASSTAPTGLRPILWVAGGGASAGTVTINAGGVVVFQVPFAANNGILFPFTPLNTYASATASVVVAGGNPSYANVCYGIA